MSDLQLELKKFEFLKKGSIVLSEETTNKYPTFILFDPLERLEGLVYMWVAEINDTPSQILYIGKAGGTLLKRCGQHVAGFKGGHPRGIINAGILMGLLKAGTQISVFSRHSEIGQVLGQFQISLCEAEEKALIAYYRKLHPTIINLA